MPKEVVESRIMKSARGLHILVSDFRLFDLCLGWSILPIDLMSFVASRNSFASVLVYAYKEVILV